MGIVPFLRNILLPPPTGTSTVSLDLEKQPRVEIYGPAGIRNFVRQIMKMTLTKTSDNYVVHELLKPEDRITACVPHGLGAYSIQELDMMHYNEVAGQDIFCSDDGFWKGFTTARGVYGDIYVDAGPISHRDPCLGYIIREASNAGRKLVILGDTHDPSAIIPLCVEPHPSLLIHEATDVHIPRHVDYNSRRTPEAVLDKALARGHSIPTMAGTFAKKIGAERLVLNHIGGRFPAPKYPTDHRSAVMREIERQATDAWGSRTPAVAAYDFMQVVIPPIPSPVRSEEAVISGILRRSLAVTDSQSTKLARTQLAHADPVEGFLYPDRSQHHSNRSKKRRP
ncbi:hypothetical protein H0H81_002960 [Sphagnurus paluster]|uniref:Uncharacterized protein n=1 Tax=Sphagnurus paluster TaxID=117069 RepID=A0A9P7GLN4_9AGAR|nr:hypothetical protein H0H81_002960 [Sphagnurus paluster]